MRLNDSILKVGNIFNDMLITRKLYKNEIKSAKLKECVKKCKYVERLLDEKMHDFRNNRESLKIKN